VSVNIGRFRPTMDWIVVQKRKRPEMPNIALVNGIHRPTDRPPHDFADVIAVGPGRYTDTGVMKPLPCAVGDVVMVRQVAGDPETIGGVEYHWCIPDEVLAVVRDSA
jgi:co-chaperonin GroES (HSP10)